VIFIPGSTNKKEFGRPEWIYFVYFRLVNLIVVYRGHGEIDKPD